MISTAAGLLGDLPDVTIRIGETGGTDPPRPIDRAVQQGHSARGQFRALGVDILDLDGEHETRPNSGRSNLGGGNQLVCRRDVDQVQKLAAELEDYRHRIL